jgi:hypothetical protein
MSKSVEELQLELDQAQRARDLTEWTRQKEEEKEYLFGDGHPEHTGEDGGGEIRLETTGIDDIHIDKHGRVIIGGEVQSDPGGGGDPWDTPVEHPGESPAERQARFAEMNEEHNPAIVVAPDEPLPQAQTEPCPECGVCSDLRNPHTNITGVVHVGGTACLEWRCRCGAERFTDGRVLPPDLAKRGDDEDEFLREVASYCEKEPRW